MTEASDSLASLFENVFENGFWLEGINGKQHEKYVMRGAP
jgi:hypothetical protein